MLAMWNDSARHLLLVGGQFCWFFVLVQLGRPSRVPTWMRWFVGAAALLAGIGACAGEFSRLEGFVMGMAVAGAISLAVGDKVRPHLPAAPAWLWRGLALVLVIDMVPVILFKVLGLRPFGVVEFSVLEVVVVLVVLGATVRWYPPALRGPPGQS